MRSESPLEFVFLEQSYSSVHSGRSLAWGHFWGDIDDPCGVIADFCGVIVKTSIHAALSQSLRRSAAARLPIRRRWSLRDSLNIIKHCQTSWNTCKTLWYILKHSEPLVIHHEPLVKHHEPLVKHHETLLKHCETSWNTQTLIIRCDDIGAPCGVIGARYGDVGARCGNRAELLAISVQSLRRLRCWCNSADV